MIIEQRRGGQGIFVIALRGKDIRIGINIENGHVPKSKSIT